MENLINLTSVSIAGLIIVCLWLLISRNNIKLKLLVSEAKEYILSFYNNPERIQDAYLHVEVLIKNIDYEKHSEIEIFFKNTFVDFMTGMAWRCKNLKTFLEKFNQIRPMSLGVGMRNVMIREIMDTVINNTQYRVIELLNNYIEIAYYEDLRRIHKALISSHSDSIMVREGEDFEVMIFFYVLRSGRKEFRELDDTLIKKMESLSQKDSSLALSRANSKDDSFDTLIEIYKREFISNLDKRDVEERLIRFRKQYVKDQEDQNVSAKATERLKKLQSVDLMTKASYRDTQDIRD